MVNRIHSLDLIKLLAICGVLLIHLMGKTSYGGVFWYAQAVPVFMVLMGYNCKRSVSGNYIVKSYIPYLLIYLMTLILALYKHTPFSYDFMPLGFLPYAGPGTYWILLFFCFIVIAPFLHKIYERLNTSLFLLLLFASDYLFELYYDLWGGRI